MTRSSSNDRLSWPDYFPSDVPPDEAQPAGGEAFRLVSAIPPTKDDFKSTYEENRKRKHQEFWKACGSSLYTDLEGAMVTRERYKHLRETKKIAVGRLTPDMGMMLSTPNPITNAHLTVWFRLNALPHLAFTAAQSEEI